MQNITRKVGGEMKQVWIVWGDDSEGRFIAGIYDDKVRAEEDMRYMRATDDGAHYNIQEKEITK